MVLFLTINIQNTTSYTGRFTLKMVAGKGFSNAPKVIQDNQLKTSRRQEHKTIHGSFAKVLSKTSSIFENLKIEYGVSSDIYVRLSQLDTFWFVGKINHKTSITSHDAIKFYSSLILEYSKALRPSDLAGKGKGIGKK